MVRPFFFGMSPSQYLVQVKIENRKKLTKVFFGRPVIGPKWGESGFFTVLNEKIKPNENNDIKGPAIRIPFYN